jgi:hypothetical protein
MLAGQSLIVDLEQAMQSGSKDRRIETLRRITDLFVGAADRLSDQQIELFDEVLGQMIERIERRALIELSRRLAPIANAPTEVVRRLAMDDDIAIAEPVLTNSARLNEKDLVDIAETKTQAHLLAISSRPRIGEPVTDVLVQRGDGAVFRKLADNAGASLSETSFAALVRHAEGDAQLTEKVALRLDIPLTLFRKLLSRATEAVRSRLLAMTDPAHLGPIQSVLATITEDANREVGIPRDQDLAKAFAHISVLQDKRQLDEPSILRFAKLGCYAEIVATLAVLSNTPIKLMERLLQSEYLEAFLIPCKASELAWPTVQHVLTCRTVGRKTSAHELDRAQTDYAKLSLGNAQRVLRFWQVRHAADAAAA